MGVGDTNPDPHPALNTPSFTHAAGRSISTSPDNDQHERRQLAAAGRTMITSSSENIDHVGGLRSRPVALDPKPTRLTTQKEIAE